MATIDIKSVSKIYDGGAQAVRDISIAIKDGEFIVLVGPSGCGKSTLLRMVAGLEEISAGEVRIGDRRVNDVDPADRDIAMVFQNYALYPHMTVRDNLAYGLKNRKTPKAEIESRVDEAARMLEIEPYLDRKPRALSGGQRQRVAMGRAIVRQPAAFLFDEPLSNLDAKLRVSMRGEIKRLQRRLGTTSLYVTHDQLEAMTLADRLVVLNKGEIEQIGSPLDVYHRPASIFVASFIGSPAMNLVKADAQGAGVKIGDQWLSLSKPVASDVALTLGFRPEDATLSMDPAQGLRFELDYVEELGAQRLLHGLVGGQPVSVVTASIHAFRGEMGLAIAENKLHAFSAATGKRLGQNDGMSSTHRSEALA
ncbi:sn-glycerol-3-phosphate import ATP-binding protein UgpC [Rhizobium sp. TRM95796]|uniref:sn-glycerol-3-phosphate import ATP-binding protein UgpC n=1 Tax=Rhizobium sp. TRM95796 TaxID=2979862 RepID=UPI0021E8A298|nr:sn-glycerol-3-phosphate import ATP-binding protein UgpC [Rhizobium sp. TRM95796]MCV3768416.1 sn-glycerol-3-phosphate import ATP-binding protein UgpC [Rhizobium sp. TRM95796]